MLNKNRAFSGEYVFLSNFTNCRVELDGETYYTVENAYQASKTLNEEERAAIRLATPKEAKYLGREITLRPDWDRVKDEIMEDLQRQKYADPSLRAKLIATGDMELVEYNYWHDNYWGSCTCTKCQDKGQNKLGKILMKIRGENR